jgi:hypothetical protein
MLKPTQFKKKFFVCYRKSKDIRNALYINSRQTDRWAIISIATGETGLFYKLNRR